MLLWVFDEAKSRIAWLKMVPLWVSLWLVAAVFGVSPTWTHLDKTLCFTCPVTVPSTKDACCEEEKNVALNAADDCRECCVAPVDNDSQPTFWPAASSTMPKTGVLLSVFVREERVIYALVQSFWKGFGRAPPRGRGPPAGFSISPLEI